LSDHFKRWRATSEAILSVAEAGRHKERYMS
jgi:hypothetical protein